MNEEWNKEKEDAGGSMVGISRSAGGRRRRGVMGRHTRRKPRGGREGERRENTGEGEEKDKGGTDPLKEKAGIG